MPLLYRLYRRLGPRYPATFIVAELQSALVVTAATAGLITFYYDGDLDQFLAILAVALGLTILTIAITTLRTVPRLRPVRDWIGGRRDPDSTAQAWSRAVSLPLDLIRRDLPLAIVVVVIPACVVATAVLELSWISFFPFFAASLVALGYAAILHYLAVEFGMRPVVVDLNREARPPKGAPRSALPLRVRLMAALPLINVITGLTVAAITSPGGGGSALTIDVLVAVAVATTISLELSILLSRSILRPIADLRQATAAVSEGRFDVRVPVTTGDELGELATSFNEMLEGLEERERLRDAFGTYVDRDVAEYILSEGFSDEGVEVEISILFADVRNFTEFAANAGAREVVARLNELFEVIVPIIRRYGGHVDKFEGDGVMAAFGAPEGYRDHAQRAVAAATEIARTVNDERRLGEDSFAVGVGVNTGWVIAGNIGGGGRLNFSVVGDAVNIASRVEGATRDTGDDVLITGETRSRLGEGFDTRPRGEVRMQGREEPIRLFAPHRERPPEPAAAGVEAESPAPSAVADGGSPDAR